MKNNAPLTQLISKEKSVYNIIRQKKNGVTTKQLLEETHYRIATLYRVLKSLSEKKLITSDEKLVVTSIGGRPSSVYYINPFINYICGVLITRDHYSIGIADLNGTVVSQKPGFITEYMTPAKFLNDLHGKFRLLLSKSNVSEDKILGIGIGAVGPLDIERGKILSPHHFKGRNWHNVSIVTQLEEKFEKPVVMEYLTKAAVLGEYWHKYSDTCQNLAYVTVNIGIGCGVIASGNVIRGNTQIVDGLGHMVVNTNGRKCSCGRSGCLETYVAVPAVLQDIEAKLKNGSQSMLQKYAGNLDIDHVYEAIEQGDRIALETIRKSAYIFSVGLINFMKIVELEVILLGGGFINRCQPFFELIEEFVRKELIKSEKKVILERVLDEDEMVVSGAATLLLESYLIRRTGMKDL